jgi:hypothetical protein
VAKKSGSTPGDVVRFVPAPEPLVASVGIGLLAVVEGAFVGLFLGSMFGRGMVIVLVAVAVLLVLIGGLMLVAKGNAGMLVGGLLLALWVGPTLAGCNLIDPYCHELDAEGAYIRDHLAPGESYATLSSERLLELQSERAEAVHDAKLAVPTQQGQAAWLGGALLALGGILSLYRKFFLPDVMIVKRRKLKYEDLM